MSLSHPIGDMLTRIRNGQNAGKESVTLPNSKLRSAVLSVLKDEGFITDFRSVQIDEKRTNLVVDLKYVGGVGAIQDISVVSKPGRRVYSGSVKMPKVLNGLGIAIVSTPNGVMTDHKARLMNVGGEVLCRVI
ncbi:MAG: 30S ribosomal protein S8 [Alphaproteobacteria bacterium]|jgi:small subunit ribosomal protein S8|nr:30S ribosomal protein S8 [Alphaproteobacteria bacterium]HOY47151.1 30S ribosomal protein S8 [Alphaproteobacteria bacterium]